MSADRLVMEKIEREKHNVMSAQIDQRKKDDLLDLLDHAENISNGGGGSLEAVAKAVAAQSRVFVKAQLEAAELCAKCKVQLTGWRGLLLEAKWPLSLFASVAVFPPNFERIASIAEKFIK